MSIEDSIGVNEQFVVLIRRYFRKVDSVYRMLPVFVSIAEQNRGEKASEIREWVDEHGSATDDEEVEGMFHVTITGVPSAKYKRLASEYRRQDHAVSLFPRFAIVAMVSLFDALMADLVRIILREKPNILKSTGKQYSLVELEKLGSLEGVFEDALERQVVGITHKSHAEQIEWIATQLKTNFDTNQDLYKNWIELSERRHTFVHNDGKASIKHRKAWEECTLSQTDGIDLADQLEVDPAYFDHAGDTTIEFGSKLAFWVWLQTRQADKDVILASINDYILDLIRQEYFQHAISISNIPDDFSLTLNERQKHLFMINRAQCYKWLGDDKSCTQLLDDIPWNSLAERFRLANYVLRNNWPEAARLMKKIGKSEQTPEEAYHDWPIFREFRETKDFQVAYQEIFNRPFQTDQVFEQKADSESE